MARGDALDVVYIENEFFGRFNTLQGRGVRLFRAGASAAAPEHDHRP